MFGEIFVKLYIKINLNKKRRIKKKQLSIIKKGGIKMVENENITASDGLIKNINNKSVSQIYEECNIGYTLPIIFNNISKRYNVNIYGTDFSVISELDNIKKLIQDKGEILGMVSIRNGEANVYYNNSQEIDVETQRFTIAHELGHCSNHFDLLDDKGRFEFSNKGNNDIHERICDKFARELLIPEDALDYFYRTVKNQKIDDLARVFLVPKYAMKIRLKELGYE